MYMVVWLATPIFLRWSLGLKPSEMAFWYLSRSCSSVRAPGSCSRKEKKASLPAPAPSNGGKWPRTGGLNWRVVGGWLEGDWRVAGGFTGGLRVDWRVVRG